MILSGHHPSISLELCLSDTSEEVLIWSNLILDFMWNLEVWHKPKIKLFQLNTGVVCWGWPIAKILCNNTKNTTKVIQGLSKSLSIAASVCVETIISELLILLFKDVPLRNHNRK